MIRRLLRQVLSHPLFSISLLIIVAAASYFRLWSLSDSFHFLGDQGRDALVVSRVFTERDLVFIGPVTSVGNMYLGPFYYYFMLPFLYLTYPSPVGPVVAVAVVNILTVFLLYYLGKKLVGQRAALIAAALMAVSATAVSLSRFSWNPNIIPFFSLVMMFSTLKAWRDNPKYWLLVGLCFSILIQLHYVAILSGVAAGLIWLVQVYQSRKNPTSIKTLLFVAVGAAAVLAISVVPLILFDYKHGWTNAKAFQALFSSDSNFVQQAAGNSLAQLWKVAKETHGRSLHIFFEFTIGKNRELNTALLAFIAGIVLLYLKKYGVKLSQSAGVWVLSAYLMVGIIGLSFYQHTVFDHYISYLFPATFLALGFCLDRILRVKYIGWLPVAGFLAFYLNYNIPRIQFTPGGPTQTELRAAAAAIHQRVAPSEPYAIVLLSESKDLYGMNYRYFLNTVHEKRPLEPEEQAFAQKLFIINEDRKTDRPQDLPIYEIVVFPNKVPIETFTLPQGIPVMVLSKNSSDQ